MKIVIVEDEIRIREGIAGLIRKYFSANYEINEACCGEEGLDIIRKFKPDIVITDIKMEQMDGLEMINILITNDKLVFKTIILSAYSEFEFAKQAISLRVKEYLIKPIDVNEFINIFKKLEDEVIHEKIISPDLLITFNSIESIFYGLLTKKIIYNKDMDNYIEDKYKIKPNQYFFMHYLYLGKIENNQFSLILNSLQNINRKLQLGNRTAVISFPDDNAILCIYYNDWKQEYLETFCNNKIIKHINTIVPDAVISIIDWFSGIESIHDSYENLKKNLQWNISTDDAVINMKIVESIKKQAAKYPKQIEKDSVSCLCTGNYESLHEQMLQFFRSFSGNYCTPDTIKKCCIRYFLAILQIIKELNYTVYETINEKEIIDEIIAAKSKKELENAIFKLLIFPVKKDKIITSVLVDKVMRLVEEHYKSGITLKEVANLLDISSDYISNQFTRYLGINFSTYIKNFRIGKAKELLAGTNLKIFEIANRIGIDDAKYFCRFFKEIEGIRPADYRKKYR